MSVTSKFLSYLKSLFRRGRMEDDLSEELQFHLQHAIEKNIGECMTPEEARYTALRSFGGVDQVTEECRDMKRVRFIEESWQDLRYGLRMLGRSPGFTAVAVLSLAVGIGANTAIYSLIHAVLFRTLPVEQPDRIVRLNTTGSFVYPNYRYYREQNQVFSGLIAHQYISLTLNRTDQTERIRGEIVTGNYFSALGVRAGTGRTFVPEEDQSPGTHPVVVISHRLWESRLGSDSGLVGNTLTLNGYPFTVVGIAPKGFRGTFPLFASDVWVPVTMHSLVMPGRVDLLNQREDQWLHLMGRLKPGVSMEAAQAQLDLLTDQLVQAHSETKNGQMTARRRIELNLAPIKLLPASGIYHYRGILPEAVIYGAAGVLTVVVGFVLLIACANVANLLLSRAVLRQREIAVRVALGAGRPRLVRQLLAESLLLSLLGGALGILLARGSNALLISMKPAVLGRIDLDLSIDTQVLCFTLLVSVFTAVVFGLAPALKTAKPDLVPALKDTRSVLGRRYVKSRMRHTLVIAQMVMSLVLLICAGLFARSLQKALAIDLGFKTENGLVLSVSTDTMGYDKDHQTKQLNLRILDRLETLPGVQSVSLAQIIPFSLSRHTRRILLEGQSVQPDSAPLIDSNIVAARYFDTLGIPLVRGRDFTDRDSPGALPVMIINETMARRFWPHQDPIGKRLRLEANGPLHEVIGVAKDSKYDSLGEGPKPFLYLSFLQNFASTNVHVLTAGKPDLVVEGIRREIQSLDKRIGLSIDTLDSHLASALYPARTSAAYMGIFGLLGLLLAATGLYGVISYWVSQRTHEMGVRMALGADSRDILQMVVRQGLKLTLIGTAFGLIAAFGLTRLLARSLYGVSPTDPTTFLAVSLCFVLVGLLASYIPAQRAVRVDPMVALKYE